MDWHLSLVFVTDVSGIIEKLNLFSVPAYFNPRTEKSPIDQFRGEIFDLNHLTYRVTGSIWVISLCNGVFLYMDFVLTTHRSISRIVAVTRERGCSTVGARFPRTEEVGGSNPPSSTIFMAFFGLSN